MIGKTILHYKILEKLGEGGMGIVYKAEDIKLKRIVALKFLPSHVTSSKEDLARFNQEAQSLSEDVVVLNISMDLPFAIARFCAAAGIDKIQTLSDHRDASFGNTYGVLIKELRLLARSILVIDAADVVRYVEIVPELTNEPNYDKALEAARGLAKG